MSVQDERCKSHQSKHSSGTSFKVDMVSWYEEHEEQRGTSGQGLWLWGEESPVQFPVELKILFTSLLAPLLHLTYGTGAVDEKDFAVSSDLGDACLYIKFQY